MHNYKTTTTTTLATTHQRTHSHPCTDNHAHTTHQPHPHHTHHADGVGGVSLANYSQGASNTAPIHITPHRGAAFILINIVFVRVRVCAFVCVRVCICAYECICLCGITPNRGPLILVSYCECVRAHVCVPCPSTSLVCTDAYSCAHMCMSRTLASTHVERTRTYIPTKFKHKQEPLRCQCLCPFSRAADP